MKHANRTGRVSRAAWQSTLIGALLFTAVGATGCQRALFPTGQPRTQFDAYDAMRNRYTPLQETDVFGRPRPALRARLDNVD